MKQRLQGNKKCACIYRNLDEQSDQIHKEARKETYIGDPGETAPSAVGSPTNEKQVLYISSGNHGGELWGIADTM